MTIYEVYHKYDFSVNIYSQILFYETKYILVLQIVKSYGFYMVIITRSKSSGANISLTADVREYFENLIKPLVTNQSLEEFLCKFKEGIVFQNSTTNSESKI